MTGGWGTPSWMGGEPVQGETYVPGKDRETARALLAACDERGVDQSVVRTVTGGFIVPNEVYDQYAATQHGI
jgi:hypothetical protein